MAEQLVDTLHAANGPPAGQVFYLCLTGASGVDYRGPVTVTGVRVDAFEAPGSLKGQESQVISSILLELGNTFQGWTSLSPRPPRKTGTFSTIYIGGDDSAFASYGGPYVGLAESTDVGNRDPSDIAFVFPDNIESVLSPHRNMAGPVFLYSPTRRNTSWANRHLFDSVDPSDPLSSVAFKGNTHVEIAKDVRADILLNNGVDDRRAGLHRSPKIVQAIKDYPDYFYGGALGPDGFPDIAYGQSLIHPENTGIWLQRIMDMAWPPRGIPLGPRSSSPRSSPSPMDSASTWPGTPSPTP